MKLGEQMVSSSEGTRALALELCREFEEKFLLHLTGGEVSSFSVPLISWNKIILIKASVRKTLFELLIFDGTWKEKYTNDCL